MTQLKRRHDQAMWLMDVAHLLRREERMDLALQLCEQAEEWEREAAGLAENELSKSILTNSANEIRKFIDSLQERVKPGV